MKNFILLVILSFPVLLNAQAPMAQLGQDIDGEFSNDLSGSSVSMNAAGDRVAIGAPLNGGNGSNSGHVRIYEYNGTSWVKLGADINGEASGDQFGFSVSMNAAGDRIAVGAPYNDGFGTDAGHVRLYQYNGTSWLQYGSDINGEAQGDHSGWSVSMNAAGDRVAIGAPDNYGYDGFNYTGHVRVYNDNGSWWAKIGSDIDPLYGYISLVGYIFESKLGYSVALNGSGNRVVIGSPFSNSNADGNRGYVRVSDYTNGDWNMIAFEAGGNNSSTYYGGDNLGYSVDVNYSGDTIIAGLPRINPISNTNNVPVYNNGAARVYKLTGTSLQQIGSDINGLSSGDKFGNSVSINHSGNKVSVGAYTSITNNGQQSGLTNIYDLHNNNWNQSWFFLGETVNDQSGYSISMSSNTRVAIGARYNDGNGSNSGHVRVFGCQAVFSTYVKAACGSYTWIDGNTYTTNNNTATYYLLSSSGCDSIVTLDLTIHNTSSTNTSQTACDSFTDLTGQTYTSSGNYVLNLQSIHGCDSTVNLNLTINNSTSSTDTQVACDSYTWTDGNTYTSSNNTAQHITTNSAGCDHTNTLNLTITNATGVDTQTACDSYTWIDGNTYTSSTNTPTHVVQTPSGCDSTITLNLDINNSNSSTQNISHCGNSYTISGTTYSFNGSYVQTIPNSLGCDSTITFNLTLNDNQFNVAFASNQQVFTQPPFFTSFTNSTPSLNNYNFTWNFGDGDVVSSNAQTINHLYDYNGLYSVTLTATNKNTGCVDSLFQNEYIYCNGGQNPPLSVGEYKAGDITIYPNPTYDEITLKINDYQGPIKVQIHDLNGKLVKEGKERNIDLTSLESGIYTLLVTYGDKEMSLKVMKK
tara:strand:- start:2108 stop:4690 length:2583 start_codon:yes stop_codon:yes gene_type:complete